MEQDNNDTREVNFSLSATTGASNNGTDANTVTAKLTNNGTLVSGIDVTFLLDASTSATFSDGSKAMVVKTNLLGECAVDVVNTVAETLRVYGVCAVVTTETAWVEMEFKAGGNGGGSDREPQMDTYYLADHAPADGVSKNTVMFALSYNGTEPLVDEYIVFNAVSAAGTAKLSDQYGVTDAEGRCTVNITNTSVEDVVITGTAITLPVPLIGSLTVDFTETTTTPDYDLSGVTVKNNAAADGAAQNMVTFTLLAGGQPVAGQILEFSGHASLHLGATIGITDANGQFSVACTSLVSNTPLYISAWLYLEPTVKTTVTDLLFSTAQEVKSLTSEVIVNNAPADGTSTNIIRYTLRDSVTRNILANQNIYLKTQMGTAVHEGMVVTNANGVATATFTDTQAGNSFIVATTDFNLSTNDFIAFTNVAPTEKELRATVTVNNAAANGTDRNAVTFKVVDKATGAGVPSIDLNFSTTGGAISSASGVTNSAGEYTLYITSSTSGNVTVTGYRAAQGDMNALNATAVVTFISNQVCYTTTYTSTGDKQISEAGITYNFQAGHSYRITSDGVAELYACRVGWYFKPSEKLCVYGTHSGGRVDFQKGNDYVAVCSHSGVLYNSGYVWANKTGKGTICIEDLGVLRSLGQVENGSEEENTISEE